MAARLRLFKSRIFPALNLNGSTSTSVERSEEFNSAVQTVAAVAEPPAVSEPIEIATGESFLTPPPLPTGSEGKPERAGAGLHEILKATDYGFNYELSLLEKYAINTAILHAQAGLPHQDVPCEDELEAEKVLRVRAAELFLDWASKVRRKVQDAIQFATVRVGDGLVQLRHSIDQLELTNRNIKDTEQRLRGLENRSAGVQKSVEYGSQLRSKFYWAMFVVLALVDWVANVPIFMQLLPRDPYAETRYQTFVQGAEKYGIWDGWAILFHRQMSSPEVSALALGLVVILMYLCHACGKSLRKLVAYRSQDEPMIELGIRSQRRQAWLSFSVTGIAVLGAVAFLFLARGRIEQVTAHQVEVATVAVQKLNTKLQEDTAKGDMDAIQSDNDQLDAAQKQLFAVQNTHNYASGIKGMNGSLGILNLVLVLAALSASYLHDKGNITEVAFGDPKMVGLESKLDLHRQDAVTHRARIRALDAEVQGNIAQAKYLAQSAPLREWPAKAARLGAVVPLFRSENARHRGTDVQLIKGFREVRYPDIVEPNQEPFKLPDELLAWERDFAQLRSVIERVQAQSILGVGVEE